MFDFNPFQKFIGLDISDFKIRFTQLNSKKSDRNNFVSFGEASIPNGIITQGMINDENKIVQILKKLMSTPEFGKTSTKYINASLPERKTYIKNFTIPNVPDDEIKGAVRWGIEKNIPVDLEKMYFDWQVLKTIKSDREKESKLQIFAAVCPRDIVDSYTRVIKKAGLTPINFENETIPIARCLTDSKDKKSNPILIIDMGRSRTSLVIYSDNVVYYSASIDVSGNEMTNAIAKSIKLNYKDAEKAKKIYGLSDKKAKGSIKKILDPIIQRLTISIQENINYYNEYIAQAKKIQHILLTGSASQTSGINDYLQRFLKLEVRLGDPLINIKIKKKFNFPKHKFIPYATSIGLALKKFS